eukprot:GEMP01109722.1.p1 GENE.GEMP01109722.1~~GEMP01109722.1.p1  ORF type:complete len:136 (-),score=5.15 GEMP01109722.1:212-619(-)
MLKLLKRLSRTKELSSKKWDNCSSLPPIKEKKKSSTILNNKKKRIITTKNIDMKKLQHVTIHRREENKSTIFKYQRGVLFLNDFLLRAGNTKWPSFIRNNAHAYAYLRTPPQKDARVYTLASKYNAGKKQKKLWQ